MVSEGVSVSNTASKAEELPTFWKLKAISSASPGKSCSLGSRPSCKSNTAVPVTLSDCSSVSLMTLPADVVVLASDLRITAPSCCGAFSNTDGTFSSLGSSLSTIQVTALLLLS